MKFIVGKEVDYASTLNGPSRGIVRGANMVVVVQCTRILSRDLGVFVTTVVNVISIVRMYVGLTMLLNATSSYARNTTWVGDIHRVKEGKGNRGTARCSNNSRR